MGSNNGTGHPLTFRCAKCKTQRRVVQEPYINRHGQRSYRTAVLDNLMGTNYEPTGRTRKPRKLGGIRCASYEVEYRCLACGHVGWTKHIDAAGKYARMMKDQ
jgi:hypothetical protein